MIACNCLSLNVSFVLHVHVEQLCTQRVLSCRVLAEPSKLFRFVVRPCDVATVPMSLAVHPTPLFLISASGCGVKHPGLDYIAAPLPQNITHPLIVVANRRLREAFLGRLVP